VLDGHSSMTQISRDPADIVAQTIGRHHQYPDGFMLFLGTLFAPVQDRDTPGQGFTHKMADPAHGPAHAFSVGTPALVDAPAKAAEAAFWSYGYSSREARAAFLNAIADEIEARADAITEIGTQETGLPEARLQGERGRTTGQLRLFAEHILKGDYLDRRHDAALPDRQPLPRPDLRMVQRPIGPVAVFGASNFPLAFSVAGGDTASALAAGCPVVVKGHSAHPGTSEIVAEAIMPPSRRPASTRACSR
jgi:alpha-ketoglutaric semialdehyde dehydrogenase